MIRSKTFWIFTTERTRPLQSSVYSSYRMLVDPIRTIYVLYNIYYLSTVIDISTSIGNTEISVTDD